MDDMKKDSSWNIRPGGRTLTPSERTAQIDDELRFDHLIGEARPEPWPLPPRRRVLGWVFRGGRRGKLEGLAAFISASCDLVTLRRYSGYVVALALGLVIWALAGAPFERLWRRGADPDYDQVLVLTYEIRQPQPLAGDERGPMGLAMDAQLTPLEVIVLSEEDLNRELSSLIRRPLSSRDRDGADAGEGQSLDGKTASGEAVWQEMLSTFAAWLERQRALGNAPWSAIRLQKVYVGDRQRKVPGALQIELLFSDRQPQLEQRLARELATLFDDIPQVGECTVSEGQQTIIQ